LDRVLFGKTVQALAALPGAGIVGRPSMLTSLGFGSSGLALVLLEGEGRRLRRVVEVFTVLPVQVALLALIGYACGVPSFYRVAHRVSGFRHVAADGGGLRGVWSGPARRPAGAGPDGVLSGGTAGGVVARRLLLAPVVA
jgi:hypothetical protein